MSLTDNFLALAEPKVERMDFEDGSFVLSNPEPLGEVARCVGDWLEYWADQTPDTIFLAERGADGAWVQMSYSQVRAKVRTLAQGLIDLGLGPAAPVVSLSDADMDQALLMLATMHIGRPFSTVSSAYSRLSNDYAKVSAILNELNPGAVFASNTDVYAPAIRAAGLSCPVIIGADAGGLEGTYMFSELVKTKETSAVMEAFQRITPETHAKYLLTSGSTGQPKIVVNSHWMLCANQKQIQLAWKFLKDEKPVLVSWLPWSHTFGTNFNFNMILCNGGSYYFDEGRPLPGMIEPTIRNLRDVRPNLFFNVPRGFDSVLSVLEQDEVLAHECLGRVRAAFYAGAALPQSTWDRFQNLILEVVGRRIMVSSSLGSTETAPVATYVHWLSDDPRCVGLPVAGTSIKFHPNAGKFELRIKGPQIFDGYLNNPEKSAEAFDAEGYYLIGDAGLLIDEAWPEKGIAFNGRVAEDFKLATGTWVSVGTLRVRAITAFSPYIQDVVVTGHDRDEVGLLLFPAQAAKSISAERIKAHVLDGLCKLKAEGGGSSQSPVRAMLLDESASVEAGEITDKGYINQRAVLARRDRTVQRLYASPTDDSVVTLE